MRFAKKKYRYVYSLYSFSVSIWFGVGHPDVVEGSNLASSSWPHFWHLNLRHAIAMNMNASVRTYHFSLFALDVVLLFLSNMCPTVSSKAARNDASRSENVMFQSEAQ